MKAAVYNKGGPPEVFRYIDVADPTPKPNEILIRNEAISIEGGDLTNRAYAQATERDHIVGYQSAGEVLWVGPEAGDFSVGDKVAVTGTHGSHAELRAVSGRTAWKVPDGLDIQVAATIPIPFGTADNCLIHYGQLKAGDTAFIQSGAGGVGVAAIQIAKRAGARVIATASSDERLAALYPLGLDHGINSSTADVVAAVMRLTDGKGCDVTLDGNGGRSLQQCVAVLGWKGRATFIGVTAREDMKIDVRSLMAGNRALMGLGLGLEMGTSRVRQMVGQYMAAIAAGDYQVQIDRSFPLAQAAQAHALIESRQAVGRVLLIP
ncbi:zinc-binding alcohol dehydrogenase family protein [soil metagenome]